MNAVFALSMYNHSKGSFLLATTSTSSKHTRENICLISLDNLLKSSKFLLDDTCVLGMEILQVDVRCSSEKKAVEVQKKFVSVQNLFLQKEEFTKGVYTWTMNNFPELDLKPPVLSPAFEIGGREWFIKMYPRGDEYSINSLSMYLLPHSSDKLSPEPGMMIELTLSILNQKHEQLHKFSGRLVFASKNGWGWSNFIALNKFKNLVGSSCIVKADITIIGSSSESQIMLLLNPKNKPEAKNYTLLH
uniref:MATH domain-containing protein n=1 Tax=Leersia perrieri TaxID=77586 RepID=A0A0D9XKM8_9ORYZ